MITDQWLKNSDQWSGRSLEQERFNKTHDRLEIQAGNPSYPTFWCWDLVIIGVFESLEIIGFGSNFCVGSISEISNFS